MAITFELEGSVDEINAEIEEEVRLEVVEDIIEALKLVMRYTPVDSGTLRSSWNVPLHSPEYRKFKASNDPVSRARSTLSSYKLSLIHI